MSTTRRAKELIEAGDKYSEPAQRIKFYIAAADLATGAITNLSLIQYYAQGRPGIPQNEELAIKYLAQYIAENKTDEKKIKKANQEFSKGKFTSSKTVTATPPTTPEVSPITPPGTPPTTPEVQPITLEAPTVPEVPTALAPTAPLSSPPKSILKKNPEKPEAVVVKPTKQEEDEDGVEMDDLQTTVRIKLSEEQIQEANQKALATQKILLLQQALDKSVPSSSVVKMKEILKRGMPGSFLDRSAASKESDTSLWEKIVAFSCEDLDPSTSVLRGIILEEDEKEQINKLEDLVQALLSRPKASITRLG